MLGVNTDVHPQDDTPAEKLPRPILDGLIIHQDPPSRSTGGLIITTDRGKDWPQTGKVMAVGPGAIDPNTGDRLPMSVKVGDHVMFERHGSSELTYLWKNDSDRWLILKDSDIIGHVEE